MTAPSFRDWQSVRDEVLRRIHARVWTPGELIPNEVDLAAEFGCARATVNRALRSLAEAGLLDRRRRAGTRVAARPVAKAVLEIAVIRHEVEARGARYGYQLAERRIAVPPIAVSAAMRTDAAAPLLHVRALHLADGLPHALEDRWINTETVPAALDAAFRAISANEWLLQHAPYTHGEIAFSAVQASDAEAGPMGVPAQSALFAMDRLTLDGDVSVTKVRLLFAPGHQLRTIL